MVNVAPICQAGTRRLRQPPSILYLIQGADVSGAERMHAALIEGDDRAMVCCPPDSRSESFARGLSARVAPLPFRPLRHSGGVAETFKSVFRGLRTAVDLRRILSDHPDRKIIFCTSLRPAMLASLAALGLKRSVFWCIPDFLPPPPLRQVVRLLARTTAAGGLCLSEAIADDFAGRSRSLRRLAPVVHPGVDPDSLQVQDLEEAPMRVAVLGHVSLVKRSDLAIEIASRAVRQVPELQLRMVGAPQFRDEDFELYDALRQIVSEDPVLERSVEWYGYANDVGEALSDCRILLHCRPDEPFGIALIEGMAAGLPVVAPAGGGPLEIVEHGVTGLLYPAGDAEAAASCVVRLLCDPAEARRMGAAGRRRVEGEFNLERQLRMTRGLLEHLADR